MYLNLNYNANMSTDLLIVTEAEQRKNAATEERWQQTHQQLPKYPLMSSISEFPSQRTMKSPEQTKMQGTQSLKSLKAYQPQIVAAS
jgi:hypothetical protein